MLRLLRFLGGGIYAPDSTTYDPIEILLNTEDKNEKDDLTIKWRDNRLSELNFVGVVVRTRIKIYRNATCAVSWFLKYWKQRMD